MRHENHKTDHDGNCLLTRDELDRLAHRDNVVAARHLSYRFLLHAISGGLGYLWLQSGEIALGLAVLVPHFVAASFLGWAGIGHELFHNSVFTSRRVNRFLFVLFSILTWNGNPPNFH